jgi:hypothetical protein
MAKGPPKTTGALPKTAAAPAPKTTGSVSPVPKAPNQKLAAALARPTDPVGDICLIPDIARFAH